MTKWPSDRVTEWPSLNDRMTDWPIDCWLSDRVAKWPNDWVTKWPNDWIIKGANDWVTGSFADDWPYGIFYFIFYFNFNFNVILITDYILHNWIDIIWQNIESWSWSSSGTSFPHTLLNSDISSVSVTLSMYHGTVAESEWIGGR